MYKYYKKRRTETWKMPKCETLQSDTFTLKCKRRNLSLRMNCCLLFVLHPPKRQQSPICATHIVYTLHTYKLAHFNKAEGNKDRRFSIRRKLISITDDLLNHLTVSSEDSAEWKRNKNDRLPIAQNGEKIKREK